MQTKVQTPKEFFDDPQFGMKRLLHPSLAEPFWFICEALATDVAREYSPLDEAIKIQAKKVADHINLYASHMLQSDNREPGKKFPYYHQGMLETVIEILKSKDAQILLIQRLEELV